MQEWNCCLADREARKLKPCCTHGRTVVPSAASQLVMAEREFGMAVMSTEEDTLSSAIVVAWDTVFLRNKTCASTLHLSWHNDTPGKKWKGSWRASKLILQPMAYRRGGLGSSAALH